MLQKIGIATFLLVASLGVGCSQPGYSVGDLSNGFSGLDRENGTELNGMRLNGMRLNGMRLNGMRLNGVDVHGTAVTGGDLLAAADDDPSVTFTPDKLTGTQLVADLDDGAEGTVIERIDSVVYDSGVGANLYTTSYWDGTSWQSSCGTDPTGYYAPPDVPIPSVALADRWDLEGGQNVADSSRFTFACINAAIGKCVVWGYKRWLSQQECQGSNCKTLDLSFFHEACTRLVRADYCGDGVYHTQNGTPLDVYDSLNIQTRTGVAGYTLEAEWRYDGGHCIHQTRWPAANPAPYDTDLSYVQHMCPSRLASNDSSCTNPNNSTFFTANGINTPLANRSILREESILRY